MLVDLQHMLLVVKTKRYFSILLPFFILTFYPQILFLSGHFSFFALVIVFNSVTVLENFECFEVLYQVWENLGHHVGEVK